MTDLHPIIVEGRSGVLTVAVPDEERQIELLFIAPIQRPAPQPAPEPAAQFPGQTDITT